MKTEKGDSLFAIVRQLMSRFQWVQAAGMQGKVKWFSLDKGYGFVVGEDGVDCYFHVRDVVGADLPRIGDVVDFERADDEKGARARGVTLRSNAITGATVHGRLHCHSCGETVSPRMATYRGEVQRSFCPVCGETLRDFSTYAAADRLVADIYWWCLEALRKLLRMLHLSR